MRRLGVTLIEAMLAITILSATIIGYLQYEKVKLEEELRDSFKYDIQKVINAFEEKLISDNKKNKEYWKKTIFSSNDFYEHIKYNFISSDSRCAKYSEYHAELPTDYIPCYMKVNLKVFRTILNGNIQFDNKDNFKAYFLKFKAKDDKGYQELKKLERIFKSSLSDSNLFSDIVYLKDGKATSYVNCLSNKNACILRVSFGLTHDYLENKIIMDIDDIKNIEEPKMISITSGNTYDSEDITTATYETKINERENIESMLKESGIQIEKEEIKKIEEAIEELKNNPEVVKEYERAMDFRCSQYDEEDYYFMSLYEKDNLCYIYKTQGINGNL